PTGAARARGTAGPHRTAGATRRARTAGAGRSGRTAERRPGGGRTSGRRPGTGTAVGPVAAAPPQAERLRGWHLSALHPADQAAGGAEGLLLPGAGTLAGPIVPGGARSRRRPLAAPGGGPTARTGPRRLATPWRPLPART